VLGDFAALEQMVLQVAKDEFLKDHGDRKRSPRGFTTGVQFSISSIEEGSAIPVLMVAITGTQSPLISPTIEEYLLRGRENILAAIEASGRNESPTKYLSKRAIAHFDRFGSSLRDGEAIEFRTQNLDGLAILTRESRRSLLSSVDEAQEYSDGIQIRGRVVAMDQRQSTFEISLPDDVRVTSVYNERLKDQIMQAFVDLEKGATLLVDGVARYSSDGRVKTLEVIYETSVEYGQKMFDRLEELKNLKAGWLDGDGEELDKDGLDWLAASLEIVYPKTLLEPVIFPTPDGGVLLEWVANGEDVSLEVDLDNHQGYYHRYSLTENLTEDQEVDLDKDEGWEKVIQCLSAHFARES
jgi:hypothetical protein